MPARRVSKNVFFVGMALLVALLALIAGWIDIHSATDAWGEVGFYFTASLILGIARPRLCWLWPFAFAFTLYAVHVWAINHGYRQPYVERDVDHAINCLDVFGPAFVGGVVGGVIGGIVSAARWP